MNRFMAVLMFAVSMSTGFAQTANADMIIDQSTYEKMRNRMQKQQQPKPVPPPVSKKTEATDTKTSQSVDKPSSWAVSTIKTYVPPVKQPLNTMMPDSMFHPTLSNSSPQTTTEIVQPAGTPQAGGRRLPLGNVEGAPKTIQRPANTTH